MTNINESVQSNNQSTNKNLSTIPQSRASQAYVFHHAIEALNETKSALPALGNQSRDMKELRGLKAAGRVPDAFIEATASLVARHGGNLMGLTFDVDAARELLAYGPAAKPFIDIARDLANQVDEDVLRRRAEIADRAIHLLRALEALGRTPEGKAVAREAQLLRATLPKRRKVKAVANPPVVTPKPIGDDHG